MLDVLKWIFESFWRFVGVWILLATVFYGLGNIGSRR